MKLSRITLAAMVAPALIAAAENKIEKALGALKADFPSHIAGPVTEKSDPAVQRCYSLYRQRVNILTGDNLGKEIYKLQSDVEDDIRRTERRLHNRDNILSSSSLHAEQQNLTWMKQKLIPYIKRIVQMQRGR